MTTEYPDGSELVSTGVTASETAMDTRALADDLVRHLFDSMVSRGAAPDSGTREYVTDVTQACLDVAVATLDGRYRSAARSLKPLEVAAAQWARDGVPIERINHAIHDGFRLMMELISSNAFGTDANYLARVRRVAMEVLETVTSTMSFAYVKELHAVIAENHRIPRALTVALLGGHDTSTITHESGIKIARSYSVLAVHFPTRRDDNNSTSSTHIIGGRVLRRIRVSLAAQCSVSALSLLNIDGGIILIPSSRCADGDLDRLVVGLSEAADIELTATCAEAEPEDIPAVVEHLRELLNLVRQLQFAPGLYRFADLAVEYQLTRPSPARRFLGEMLAPLDAHPMLMDTLRTHIGNNFNRRRSARDLNIHTNTIDYRLKKIGELTGFDPTQPGDLWHLQSALIVRKADVESA